VESDPLLRRLERTALVACLAMAGVALALAGGRPGPALGVIGGWLLIEVAYRSIHGGVTAMVSGFSGGEATADPAARRRLAAVAVARFAGRYALLAVLAYVMIARLRLHPVGLMAGASSAVAAAAVEAVRFLVQTKKR
jgi:hypothetical protein